jgi:hypothetical protein
VNKSLLILSLPLFLFLKSEKTFATHVVGADLTYVCNGGNDYSFSFTLYRDCSGISVNSSYVIKGTSSCGDSVFITVNLDSTVELIHTCSSVATKCTNAGNAYLGVEANYYHGNITLLSICNFWTFGIDPAICNRSNSITNLDPNGAAYCLYVKATLNSDAVQCNHSAVFGNAPILFLCAAQVQYNSQSAYDADGDSLTYQMVTPHSDADSDVHYLPGLSGIQPVYYISPTLFNNQTGDLKFQALNAQISVMAIEVSEYRNGVLVGTVERDLELIFDNCTNILPTASGINGGNFYSAHVCADSILSFNVISHDVDSGQHTWLSWNGAINGGLFTTSGTYRDTGHFFWQPDTSFVSAQPYIFSVTVTDSACPYIGIATYTYAVFVDSCAAIGTVVDDWNYVQQFSAGFESLHHTIHFNYRLNQSRAVLISLYDLTGRKFDEIAIGNSLKAQGSLDAGRLSKGLYLLRMETADGISKTVKVNID